MVQTYQQISLLHRWKVKDTAMKPYLCASLKSAYRMAVLWGNHVIIPLHQQILNELHEDEMSSSLVAWAWLRAWFTTSSGGESEKCDICQHFRHQMVKAPMHQWEPL